MPTSETVNAEAATERLMRYIAVPGQSGQEKQIADAIVSDLKALGVPDSAIRFDTAHERIDVPTEIGNLFVDLPGTSGGDRIMFSTHMDVVPICDGAVPKRDGDRIVPEGNTGLGGDNRTGCAVLVTLIETLLKNDLPHPPITLLFTVREESGLQGAAQIDGADFKGAVACFNFDGKLAHELIIGAVGAEAFTVEIHGKAAHAGVAPEKGISTTLVASLAIADVHRGGWFGKVKKDDGHGTSNIGVFGGKKGKTAAGDATNVVTDYTYIRGETRSPDTAFAAKITAAYRAAFERAAAEVKDASGENATVKFDGKPQYPSFNLGDDTAAVAHAKRAVESMGLTPTTVFSNGGLDANWLVKHGVPTVTFGAGQYEIHTVKEYVDVPEYVRGCQLAVALATLPGA